MSNFFYKNLFQQIMIQNYVLKLFLFYLKLSFYQKPEIEKRMVVTGLRLVGCQATCLDSNNFLKFELIKFKKHLIPHTLSPHEIHNESSCMSLTLIKAVPKFSP